MADTVQQQLGQRVRDLRLRAGLTQEGLSDRSGLHVTYIAGIETGRRNPSLMSIVAVANGLGLAASELLRGVSDA
jgi:transcriptional regulator with XRE-family HTH domain